MNHVQELAGPVWHSICGVTIMRAPLTLLFLSALLGMQAQVVEMPRVEMPSVEMPRVEMLSVEMPRVEMPSVGAMHGSSARLPDSGQVLTETGLPAGSWERTGFKDHIRLIDPFGRRGIELYRTITGKWEPWIPDGSGSWSMDRGTGTLRKDF